jgi:hypothetical protein
MVTGSEPDGITGKVCTTAPCWFNWSMRAVSPIPFHVSVTEALACTVVALATNDRICGALGVADAGGVFVAVLVGVRVKVGVIVDVDVTEAVLVARGVNVSVLVGVEVLVGVGVDVGVRVAVGVGVRVGVSVGVALGSTITVGSSPTSCAGCWQPAPRTSITVKIRSIGSRAARFISHPDKGNITVNMKHFLMLIILVIGTACQQTLVAVESSPEPSVTPLPAPTIRATQTPRHIDLPTSTPVSTAAPTVFTIITGSPLTLAAPLVSPLDVNDPSAVTAVPTLVAPLVAPQNTFVVGQSVQGRDIVAWRFGSGERILLLVGGIHAGFEANTTMLVNELVTHFSTTPAAVLPGMTIILIPIANPDGFTLGRTSEGRFNANDVDLNRNWGCEWSPTAYWQDNLVSPGGQAFSEPETRALAGLIRDLRPAAAIFYHSAADGVFAGSCEGDHGSAALAAVIGEASGYPYGAAWSAYPVTGTAATWADGMGVPAVDLELSGTRETEFVPNLRGIMAVQSWLTGGTP